MHPLLTPVPHKLIKSNKPVSHVHVMQFLKSSFLNFQTQVSTLTFTLGVQNVPASSSPTSLLLLIIFYSPWKCVCLHEEGNSLGVFSASFMLPCSAVAFLPKNFHLDSQEINQSPSFYFMAEKETNCQIKWLRRCGIHGEKAMLYYNHCKS